MEFVIGVGAIALGLLALNLLVGKKPKSTQESFDFPVPSGDRDKHDENRVAMAGLR